MPEATRPLDPRRRRTPASGSIKDLTKPEIRFVAIAQPELAPYGEAAVQALKASALWDQLQPKVVYAGNINLARQFAATGNADAAFTAFSLVRKNLALVLKIDPALHQPLNQGPRRPDRLRPPPSPALCVPL